MRIVHVTGNLSRLGGGIPPVVWGLAGHQVDAGARVTVAGLDDAFFKADSPRRVPCLACRPTGPRALGASLELRRCLKAWTHGVDVVHAHGLWMYPGAAARKLAVRARAALVISPHGMLEPWALQRSRWKKKLAGRLFEGRNLRRAACLHALCRAEAESIRAFGIRQPIAVIPNGIEPSDYEPRPEPSQIFERFPQLEGRKVLLFMARLHPKKGLEHLLHAWAQLGGTTSDWVLMVAGQDEGGHGAAMARLAGKLSVDRSVVFAGPLYGRARQEALAGAAAFVLPSFSEGMSMAILEAAACGLPVVMTPQCNFPELIEAGGGLLVDPAVPSTAAGLEKLIAMTDADRRAMGMHGRRLVLARYTWRRIAGEMLEVYRWLLRGGPQPACIVAGAPAE